jgi:hypothetical protein
MAAVPLIALVRRLLLVGFFNVFGNHHVYGQGFPSRISFSRGCIRELNDTPALEKIILASIDQTAIC